MYIITRSPFEVRATNFDSSIYYGVSVFTQYGNEMPIPIETPKGLKFIAFLTKDQANEYVQNLVNMFGLKNTIIEGNF